MEQGGRDGGGMCERVRALKASLGKLIEKVVPAHGQLKVATLFESEAFQKISEDHQLESMWKRAFVERSLAGSPSPESLVFEYDEKQERVRRKKEMVDPAKPAAKTREQRQLNHYFGKLNYPNDKWLHTLEDKDGFIELNKIRAFKKIQAYKEMWLKELIAEAISSSKLSFNPSGNAIQYDDGEIKDSSFVAYQKIYNSSDRKLLHEIRSNGLDKPDVEWVATEKIHGANFSFYSTGGTVRVAKRRSLLKTSETFVKGYEEVVERHKTYVRALFQTLKGRLHSLQMVIVFGELFGGSYPHPEVAVKEVSRVQKGVFYSPGLHFEAYDVAVFTGVNGTRFLDFDEMCEALKASGFPLIANPVLRGPLNKILAFDVETFQSRIPAKLGLPKLKDDNIAEGIVVRLAKEAENGNRGRFILKYKSERFAEVARSPKKQADGKEGKKSQRKKKNSKKNRSSLVTKSLEATRLMDTLCRFVTENRLRAVMSKILGEVKSKDDVPRIAKLLSEDALEDFLADEENGEKMKALSKEINEAMHSELEAEAKITVYKNIKHILAGTF